MSVIDEGNRICFRISGRIDFHKLNESYNLIQIDHCAQILQFIEMKFRCRYRVKFTMHFSFPSKPVIKI